MRRLLLVLTLTYLILVSARVLGSEISNFFTPYGFRTPLLEKGQYAWNSNWHYYRSESRLDYTSGRTEHYEVVLKRYHFSLNGVCAVTDKVVFQGNLEFSPAQRRLTSRQTWTSTSFPQEEMTLQENKYEQHSNFYVSPQLVISFRPKTNMEFYGTFHFDKEKLYTEKDDGERTGDETRTAYNSNVGFAILGGANTTAPAFSSGLSNFLRPYGFGHPMLKQGQYALNLNWHYYRHESEQHWKASSKPAESTHRRYYLSLNGVYALTEELIFRGNVDFYPAQTRENYDRSDYHLYFSEVHSDFGISPGVSVSVRPKSSLEFYNSFSFMKENLEFRPSPPFTEQRDERRKTYNYDFGLAVLGGLKTVGISSSELSDFVTPYGFKTPMLKRGQYAMNLGSHYYRSESEYDYPPTSEVHYESLEKHYYFSLTGIYAATNRLVFRGTLDLYPDQNILATRNAYAYEFPLSHTDTIRVSGEDKIDEHSSFAIFPRLDVSFRPNASVEVYGSFGFNKEKLVETSTSKVSSNIPVYIDDYTADEKREAFYFDFGVTILGGLW